jgi:hypothetical protein
MGTITRSFANLIQNTGVKNSHYPTPYFYATMTGKGSDQTGISDNTDTKVLYGTEVIDTDNAYDSSTNYRFTCPAGKGGKYYFQATVNFVKSSGNARSSYVSIIKNAPGATTEQHGLFLTSQYFQGDQDCTITTSCVITLIPGDFVEVYGRRYDGTNTEFKYNVGNSFFGYKLTD